MIAGFPWSVLGIEPTEDRKAIRSAYAARLKAIDPDADVQGFSTLREARQEALWLAREGIAATDREAPFDDFAPMDDAFPVAADDERDPLGAGWDAQAPEPAGDTGPVEIAPVEADRLTHEADMRRLLDILQPGGEHSTEPLTAEEYEEGAALMRSIMEHVQDAAIDRQSALEGWLAHWLASGWPRSGPLVEDAVETFEWGRDAGLIDEHPAVAFLNDRLRALAFLEAVQQPDHEWHKAYVELRKPGKRSRLPWQGTNIANVNNLLIHINENYPELHEYLDSDRVASYAEPDEVGSPWRWVLIVIAVLWFGGRLLSAIGPSDNDLGAMPQVELPNRVISTEQRDELARELVGEDYAAVDLVNAFPALYYSLNDLHPVEIDSEEARTRTLNNQRQVIRRSLTVAATTAGFEELVAIKQHRLDMLRATREQEGGNGCLVLIQGGTPPVSVSFDEEFLTRERDLAGRLVASGTLAQAAGEFPESASIPGDMVDEVMTRMGISRGRFEELASGGGDAAGKCDYAIAMLEAILRRPGSVSADLLRMS
ncbi:hypothetical protein [Aurantiacibacter gangjinensis]|uniref:Uncharacterized protein n=1 Tax=Aurantiacibacter gangjinensis TaxID=502682 RepID=A0A0G9MP75_9SPHN|nr:hypothetical protein [Aurantiacibacter gangjinensis]APE28281.1 hypothetical protein BMF35_a1452 [Aurantiacibacter gangjinensis]KLE32522.1 hypothetical protein AAW01_00145 [Aurantiacibacter gangjinensis]